MRVCGSFYTITAYFLRDFHCIFILFMEDINAYLLYLNILSLQIAHYQLIFKLKIT